MRQSNCQVRLWAPHSQAAGRALAGWASSCPETHFREGGAVLRVCNQPPSLLYHMGLGPPCSSC